MRKSIILIVLFSLLLIGCNRDNNLGEYVQTTCPIPVPQDLIDSGKFTYGFIKVPEIGDGQPFLVRFPAPSFAFAVRK